eukprot:TRINITY_DN6695_c0_g1_i1.p1 TRINITY_DN6695_c0_g1~~TRINITY_DN6695_c0_g1_i1.p1  ORF type:complete len:618 (+),score=218.89 TRINITY_DN6695_c0_g1_i1:69-1922(+)
MFDAWRRRMGSSKEEPAQAPVPVGGDAAPDSPKWMQWVRGAGGKKAAVPPPLNPPRKGSAPPEAVTSSQPAPAAEDPSLHEDATAFPPDADTPAGSPLFVNTAHEFQAMLGAASGPVVDEARLMELAAGRGVPDDLRGVYWRLLLKYLPPEKAEWEGALAAKRATYRAFCEELIVIPDSVRKGHAERRRRQLAAAAKAAERAKHRDPKKLKTGAWTPGDDDDDEEEEENSPPAPAKKPGPWTPDDDDEQEEAAKPAEKKPAPPAVAVPSDGNGGGPTSLDLLITHSPTHGLHALGRIAMALKAPTPDGGEAAPAAAPAGPRRESAASGAEAGEGVEVEVGEDHDPLAEGDNAVWTVYKKNQHLLTTIDVDVPRTMTSLHFFNMEQEVTEESSLRDMDIMESLSRCTYTKNQLHLRRLLFIFVKLNPGLNYVQGMNEIAGHLFYTLARASDATLDPNGTDDAEADAFYCFTALIAHLGDNFCRALDNDQLGLHGSLSSFEAILKRCDKQLWQHLDAIGLRPCFYCFRWVTLLLSQELMVTDVQRIWDFLFSDVENITTSLYYACTAMLELVRDDLLGGDFSVCMQLLQDYPPMVSNMSDGDLLVATARRLMAKPKKRW